MKVPAQFLHRLAIALLLVSILLVGIMAAAAATTDRFYVSRIIAWRDADFRDFFTRKGGELAFAPRNVPHPFANLSGAEARTLIICTPTGFERYFDRLAAEQAGVEPPPEASKAIPEVIVVGPRIGELDPEAQRSNRKERSS